MTLGEAVTYPSLEVVEHICTVCVPSGFHGKAGSDVTKSDLFPQGVLAALW